MEATLLEQIVAQAKTLPPDRQQDVLEFIRTQQSLKPAQTPPGTPGTAWKKFAGSISPEDLVLMERAIEEGCEQVDADGW